jgi:hypothetical protein
MILLSSAVHRASEIINGRAHQFDVAHDRGGSRRTACCREDRKTTDAVQDGRDPVVPARRDVPHAKI